MQLYGKGLAAAAQLKSESVKAETLKTRHSAFRELSDRMQLKYTACNRSVQEATPEEIMVYFTQHWLPAHAGSITTEGEHIAAPGSLSSRKSHLSSKFELLGCTGDWNPTSQTGRSMLNPSSRDRVRNATYEATGNIDWTEAYNLSIALASICHHQGTPMRLHLNFDLVESFRVDEYALLCCR